MRGSCWETMISLLTYINYVYIYIFTKTNFWCLLHNMFLHCEQTHPTIGWNLYLWLHTIDPQNSRDEDFRCRWFMRCCKCVHAVCCCALRKSQKHEIVGQFNVHWSQWNQNMARIWIWVSTKRMYFHRVNNAWSAMFLDVSFLRVDSLGGWHI